MTLLVEDQDEMFFLKENDKRENDHDPKRSRKSTKRFRRSVILSVVSAAVSMVTFAACLTMVIFISRALSQQKQIGQIPDQHEPSPTLFYPGGSSPRAEYPVSYMVLDRASLTDDYEMLRWQEFKNQTYTRGGIKYSDGFFEIPQTGYYDMHLTLSFDTHSTDGGDYVMIYNCIVTSSRVTLGCNRMIQRKGWAGQSHVLVMSRWLARGERVGATLTPGNSKKSVHGNPQENALEIRLVTIAANGK